MKTDEESDGTVRRLAERLVMEVGGADSVTFLGAQFDAGLSRVDFPVGHGGLAVEPKLQDVVDRVLEAAGRSTPRARNPVGIGMCAPTIVARGTEEQMSRFLRPIYTAEEVWCQLFSEPGSGSDVASLATRAVRDGKVWVINGQKVWTSLAHRAAWGLLLARTDPDAPKHKGLTAFIVDMRQPGIAIRPLRQMSGSAEQFNEVFFTDASTPDHLRVGDVGDGWGVATATLMNERVSIGGDVAGRGSGPIAAALDVCARRAERDGSRRDQLARLWVDAEVLRLSALRAQRLRQKGVPGPEGSVLKLSKALLEQRIAAFVVDVLGAEGMVCSGYGPGAAYEDDGAVFVDPVLNFLGVQGRTIAGGTSQIMRNILGERVLGLPREPGVDSNTPWNQIARNPDLLR